jgi:hypothetical protein
MKTKQNQNEQKIKENRELLFQKLHFFFGSIHYACEKKIS